MESYNLSDFAWLQNRLMTLQAGQTGVQYDALVRFSSPLWAHYGLEKKTIMEELEFTEDLEILDAAVSILESARMLWAYYRLSAAQKNQAQKVLESRMLGESPELEDQMDFEALLDRMEAHFKTFKPSDIEKAETVAGHPTLDFTHLIEVMDADHESPTTQEIVLEPRFGPESLNTPDAIAIFAEPLIEQADFDDPDAFDIAFSKASDYWELAQLKEAEFEQMLTRIKRKYAQSPKDLALLETEARQMIERFHKLFAK